MVSTPVWKEQLLWYQREPLARTPETKEFLNGKWVTITDTFKDYQSPESCIEDLIRLWYKDYRGYHGVNRASSWEECCHLLRKEGYATDPDYPQKLIRLIKQNS
jgi:flagellum-specific peptidoglycan hydrolase FlgJ